MSIYLVYKESTKIATKLRQAAQKRSWRCLRLMTYVLISALILGACAAAAPASSVEAPVPVAADTATPEPEPTNTPVSETEPVPTPTPPAREEADADSMPSTASQTFAIVAEESEARFLIDELLFGAPKTVIGTTRALSGELTVNPTDPPTSAIGPIQIDASTFVTDHNRRNGAIRRFILQTNQHQFITFTTTALSGLPHTVSVGDEVHFDVTGDLTIRDITNPVSFAVTLQIVSESELRGSATTVVTREAYELTIPQVPNVANVGEEFIVEFDFVARADQ